MSDGIFATWASTYRDQGFWPRPVQPETKACKIKGWQTPDPDLPLGKVEGWSSKYATHGIGLLLGSPAGDGTVLAALDIDDDRYVRVAEVILGDPICGRIGARGAAYFVRIRGDVSYRGFKAKGEADTKIGELLVRKRLVVIPPTVHPDTTQPYRWTGSPLHEVDVESLPIIEASS